MFNDVNPGSEIIITPKNPTKTASHLYKRTFSFNKNIEKMVVNIGAAKVMLTTVASGRFLNATNIEINANNPARHLFKCRKGLCVL